MVIGDLQNESGGIKKYPYTGEVLVAGRGSGSLL